MDGPAKPVRKVKEESLNALDTLPLSVYIVTYAFPPRNLWANSKCLEVLGLTFPEFVNKDLSLTATEGEKEQWKNRYQAVQLRGETVLEKSLVADGVDKQISVETVCSAVVLEARKDGNSVLPTNLGGEIRGVMIHQWPLEVKSQLEANTKYMTSLLECSPYPLCFFTFDGHLITCNPAAVAVFGNTIWLQSDIFGMGERERRGLNASNAHAAGSFGFERTERRTAYESMIDALTEDGSVFEVDLLIRRRGDEGNDSRWYCRLFAQRHKDPVTGEPMIMISHQDVTNLRKVEGELGRMEMSQQTTKELMRQHDSDVAGSLMVLLGEDFGFSFDNQGGEGMSEDGRSQSGSPRSVDSSVSTESTSLSTRTVQLDGLRQCLERANDWSFNVFDLEREADGLPLQVLSWHVFLKHNLIEEFNLDHVKLVNFLRAIESGHSDNPYHNATHVADVVQSMHCLLVKGGLHKFVGRLELLAGLMAACIHDFEHKGFNNDFLIKTNDDWAIDSNDKSPNETHHIAAAYRILRQPECNFLYRMPNAQQAQLRKMVIDMVLATDMAEHMAIVSKLKSDLQKRLENPDDGIGDDPPESLKTLVLQGAIKVADIGHLYAMHEVHITWSERLEEEMWRQGDVEKESSMKVSFLMDRDKPGVTKSQPGFVDFVVRPLFEVWVACFPDCRILLDRINDNYNYWKSKEIQAEKS
mmetsp:Transcript_19671/g.40067  ORF Transcript_19671/g.40067 Transcript_19671/m.40067 type:complete len:698 (+) Transcript_19671:290-2383(+)|eukprot:CAMPEP_0181331762 /NCGR_PEP_ID=MMETSP1101-20121128/24700_1 /TAXON_ID=46948 /ORGANISM="Rhodomonas abbreviata, Strain Caron Lab Isolate" /LENGTH=697 /DNA_ID=CAMNT_0023441295 /DNA_START=279 /DNA_END=2372 /DNA_ORIENTATION=-